MDSPFFSLTNIIFYLILLIIVIAFGCHYFGPKNSSWIQSNKEEKIRLSKNNLFHANGYVIHTGSDFFPSSSGSFKRFDTVDKGELSKENQHSCTPMWSLPEVETEIPPQPLRPAPAPTPLSATNSQPHKTVKFSFSDEKLGRVSNMEEETHFIENHVSQNQFPEMKPAFQQAVQPLEAPPPSRNGSNNYSHVYPSSAIPRPTARRSFLNGNQDNSKGPQLNKEQAKQANGFKLTNPFLSESAIVESSAPALEQKSPGEQASSTPSPVISQNNPFSNEINARSPKVEFRDMRQRSFSENEVIHETIENSSNRTAALHFLRTATSSNPFSSISVKLKGPHLLQKTISEDYLFRKFHRNSLNATGNVNNPLWRQDSSNSLAFWNNGSTTSIDSANLEKAISCDSVTSEDKLNDLLQIPSIVSANLFVKLTYDSTTTTQEGIMLTVHIGEVRDIVCPFPIDSLDTFIRVYLVPDQVVAQQTQIIHSSDNPIFDETFDFWLMKNKSRHSLWFHLYHNGSSHTLLGEAELEINEVPNPVTTWLPLSDNRVLQTQYGELMFSLSYLPTAERLTIVIVKARNLDLSPDDESTTDPIEQLQNIFVKVYVINNEKKVLKKRTSLKKADKGIIFNEAMIFSMPPTSLTTLQLRFTIYGTMMKNNSVLVKTLGHIIAGSCTTGKGLRHWHQMLSSLRKPVAMWHALHRFPNQTVFVGGADAVVAAMKKPPPSTISKRNSIF